MYRDIWKLLKKDWRAHLSGTLAALSPLIGAAVAWDVICLLVMATAVPVYSGRIDTPEPANPWLAAHLQDWMLAVLAILSLLMLLVWFLLGPWMHMGIYGGLTDSLRGGKMGKADAFMFRGRMRRTFSVSMLVRTLSLLFPALLGSILGGCFGLDAVLLLPPGLFIALLSVLIVRYMLAFIPPLQADFPQLSGWELCTRSQELLRRFGPLRLMAWTLPGVSGYFVCSLLFWICLVGSGSPVSIVPGWTLAALLTALPAMYTRAAVSVAYDEALRRDFHPVDAPDPA